MVDTVLDGIRVLDLTDEKGRYCGRLLEQMGAEVVRLEKPGGGKRGGAAGAGKRARSRSIALDIETEKGRRLFHRQAAIADVLVESYPPGYLDMLGSGYSALSETNTRLIMASITHFGQSGPYRDYRSSPLVSAALGGQVFVNGDKDRPPLQPYGPQAYYTACLFAANGILLALHQRHNSGKGQYIDISVHECTASTLDHQLVRYFYEGVVAERDGSLYWNYSSRIFPCKDGYILLSLMYQWETLVEWLASEGSAGDLTGEKWRDEDFRRKNIAHIIEVLEKWTLKHGVDELVETGQLMHFPWARVATPVEVLEKVEKGIPLT